MANTGNPPDNYMDESTDTASENENSTSWEITLFKPENRICDSSQLVDVEQFRAVQFLGEKYRENPEEIDLTTSSTNQNLSHKTEDGSVTEDSKSLMDDLFQTDSESLTGNHEQLSHSPVKVDKIVLSAIKKLDSQFGSTLCEIKKYIDSNCDVDVNSIDQDIKKYLRNAVSNGVLIKADQWRYSVPVPKTRRKKAKGRNYSKKRKYGKPKKPRRAKRAILHVSSSDGSQDS